MIQILTTGNFEFMNRGAKYFSYNLEKLVSENLLNKDLSVKWLADQMFYSERQMHRLVKKYTGKTAHGYIREVRLNQAKVLLERRVFNTKEVAYRVGYQKASWFSAQYFLRFGVRPRRM